MSMSLNTLAARIHALQGERCLVPDDVRACRHIHERHEYSTERAA